MTLKGNIQTVSLGGIVQLLGNENKTGILRVYKEKEEYQIFYLEGSIIYAIQSKKEARLGELLIRDGLITEKKLEEGLTLIAFTDGLIHAGSRTGEHLNIQDSIQSLLLSKGTAQSISDNLMEQALNLDQGRPVDDISVVVIQAKKGTESEVRKISVHMPIS